MRNRKLLLPLLAVALVGVGAGWLALYAEGPGGDMTQAAEKFLGSLTDQQRDLAVMDFESPKRVDWHFIPKKTRKGLQLRDMTEKQRKLAHELLRASLSEIGYDKADTIMELEKILKKLEGKDARFDRDYLKYYFTVFGKPSLQGEWGLSIEGHHLSLNFVVKQGQVTAHTPAFFGANPGLVMEDYGVGPKKGTRVLHDEEALGFKLFNSFNDEQRPVALIAEKAPRDLRSAGDAQAPDTPPAGLAAAKMNDQQVKTLWALIETYAENMPKEIARKRINEIEKAGIEKVHFAWAGADRPGIGHYYRIQGPTFLVELCNTQPDAAGNPANHIHSFWRDTRGDFGIPADSK